MINKLQKLIDNIYNEDTKPQFIPFKGQKKWQGILRFLHKSLNIPLKNNQASLPGLPQKSLILLGKRESFDRNCMLLYRTY